MGISIPLMDVLIANINVSQNANTAFREYVFSVNKDLF